MEVIFVTQQPFTAGISQQPLYNVPMSSIVCSRVLSLLPSLSLSLSVVSMLLIGWNPVRENCEKSLYVLYSLIKKLCLWFIHNPEVCVYSWRHRKYESRSVCTPVPQISSISSSFLLRLACLLSHFSKQYVPLTSCRLYGFLPHGLDFDGFSRL